MMLRFPLTFIRIVWMKVLELLFPCCPFIGSWHVVGYDFVDVMQFFWAL